MEWGLATIPSPHNYSGKIKVPTYVYGKPNRAMRNNGTNQWLPYLPIQLFLFSENPHAAQGLVDLERSHSHGQREDCHDANDAAA